MQKDTSSPSSSPKLSSGYTAFFYIPFFALFIFDVLSGAVLFFHGELDFYKFFLMKAHVVSGFLVFFLFLFLSLVHLKRLYSGTLIFFTFLAAFSFYILCAMEAHPPSAFAFFVAVNAFLAWRYLLGNPTLQRAPVIFGVLAWVLFNLIFASGLAMAGPMKSFRTDMFNTVHKWVSVFFTPLLFYHLLSRQKNAVSSKTALAVFVVFFINARLFVPAHKQAKWFQAHRARKDSFGYLGEQFPGKTFSLQNAKTCGEVGCHTEIYKEWRASTHRYSASNLHYRKVFALFKREAGENNAGFCEKCHNPDVVIFAEQSKDEKSREFFTEQGVSCLSCHLISKVNVAAGNGAEVFEKDVPYLPGFAPKTKKDWEMLHYFIRTDLRRHRKNYQRRPFHQTAEYCVACHRVTVPAEVNGAKTFTFEGPYASWSKSRYAKEGITCQHCHMQLFEFKDPQSIEREMHARPDHRTFGVNAALAFYLPDALRRKNEKNINAFSKNTSKWLRGALRVSDYEQWFLRYVRDGRAPAYDNYFHNKKVLSMDIQVESHSQSEILTLFVKTKNERIGHDFPVSLLDMIDVWLEVKIQDAKGHAVFTSGMMDKNFKLPENAHRLGATYLDKDGNVIDRHRVWKAAGIKNKRVIPPHGDVKDFYKIKLYENVSRPLTVKARWLYRRANPEFSHWVFDNSKKTFPVIEIVSVEKILD